MALFPTSPHQVNLYAYAHHHGDVCPAVSIISDDWPLWTLPAINTHRHRNPRMGLAANGQQGSDPLFNSPLCLSRLGLPRSIADNGSKFDAKSLATGGAATGADGTTRFQYLDPPTIAWLDPATLIPHEPTSAPHLERLIGYLKDLDDEALLPTIIVTQSSPHVILDGHHRWQSSLALGIPRVPCWVVDDHRADTTPDMLLPVPHSQFLNATSLTALGQQPTAHQIPSPPPSIILEDNSDNASLLAPTLPASPPTVTPATFSDAYTYYRVRVYDTRSYSVLRIRDIADRARAAHAAALAAAAAGGPPAAGFGVKGTKHVAVRVPTLPRAPAVPILHASAASASGDDVKGSGHDDADTDDELRLEKVAPVVEWGWWKRAGAGFASPSADGVDVAHLRSAHSLGEVGMSLVRDDDSSDASGEL
ncbi:hypothetical protein BC828DRAFT_378808 [Blastocladiella britannica]|nr:hypothetical protein BC828DRAFT_378808 [Blastocladiella britannica]